ncbi:MAG: hypothetical protein R8M38_02790 [Mariprofundaceae bacterium]
MTNQFNAVNHILKTTIILGVILSLSGCGGSGTSISSTARPIATDIVRSMTTGDLIDYTLSGSIQAGAASDRITGTSTSSITLNGTPPDANGLTWIAAESTIFMELVSGGASVSSNAISNLSQDSSGTIYIHGDSESGWITSPVSGKVPGLKSPIVINDNWLTNVTYQNGDLTNTQYSIEGTTFVSTPLGSFEAYDIKAVISTTKAAGGRVTEIQHRYVVPGIGSVKLTSELTITDSTESVSQINNTLLISTTNISF